MTSRCQPSTKRYLPVNSEKAAQKKDKLRHRKPVASDRPERWEIVRDILYRMPLCRNDPEEFCPGGKVELVSREIAKALT